MMRWLTRLLHASGSARHFLKGSVIVPTSARSRLANAGSEPAQTKPLPHPKPSRKTDPRLVALKLASDAKRRQEAASRHPELRPPHAILNSRENQALELAFWRGLFYKDVGKQLGVSTARATQLSNRALRKLDFHYRPTQGQEGSPSQTGTKVAPPPTPSPLPVILEDPRITALRTAGPAPARQEVAGRYPELRPPHTYLSDLQNELLELAYWQGLRFKELEDLKDLSGRRVSTSIRQALKQLDRHLHRESHQDEDSLDAVLLALNACGSVKHAATKLGLNTDVLNAFMQRAGIKARTVFEVDTGEHQN